MELMKFSITIYLYFWYSSSIYFFIYKGIYPTFLAPISITLLGIIYIFALDFVQDVTFNRSGSISSISWVA